MILQNGIIIKMEKKDSKLPSMHKTLYQPHNPPLVKVRSTLASKQKENKLQKSLQSAKAKNFINKVKSFNSPELIYALNDSIRLQTSLVDHQLQQIFSRQQNINNKTFHSFGLSSHSLHKSKPKLYAINQQRQKAQQLSKWIQQKLEQIKNKKQINLDDILDYNQTVVNYGLGQIIESVRKRCKQQGQTLKIIWDNTFVLFQNLVNVLAEQIKVKDQEAIRNQNDMHRMFQVNLGFLKNKNIQLTKHLDLLYQKMKKIVIWNRTLRKDRFKQQIQLRVRQYRISSYISALQQSVNMLLQQSNEPNCLKLAKKIITNLYKQKTKTQHEHKPKHKHKHNENKPKPKPKQNKKTLQSQAHEHVHENTKQFVMNWLKKYSLQEQEDIRDAIHLSYDEKIEIINIQDKKQADNVNIYDFFTAKSKSVQTQLVTVEKSVQFQDKMVPPKVKNVGVQTKKTYFSTIGIQIDVQKQLNQNQTKPLKKLTAKSSSKNIRKSPLKLKKKNSISLTNQISDKNIKSFKKLQKSGDKSRLQKVRRSIQSRQRVGINQPSYIQSQNNMRQEWQTGNQIFQKNDKISQQQQEGEIIERSQNYKSQYDMQDMYKDNGKSSHKYEYDVLNQNKQMVKRVRRLATQKFITEEDEATIRGYKVKSLKKIKFEQTYQKQMKKQYEQNKQQMIANVVRRRSFYKISSTRKQKNQKQLILMWSRPTRNIQPKQKRQLNQLDQLIYSYFNSLIKPSTLPINYSKFKTFQQTCTLFSTVSSNLNPQRTIPKNKQFINLSVNGIIKFVSRLLFDYLRKIRGEYQGVYAESQRAYYPLSVILVDHMMHKYGLKEIAEKKLRDFMEKIGNFVGVSEKLSFLYRLFGVRDQLMCADQLVIYMKCLIIPIMNTTKDFSIDRIVTDRETVLANIDIIINQFFPQQMRAQVKWKIQRYFHMYQLICVFDVQRIATMLIDQFVIIKKQQYKNYAPLYKNCQGNIFPNLLKAMQIYTDSEILVMRYSKMLQEIFRSSDLIDQNYGKSISQLRFVGACIKVGFPKFQDIYAKVINVKKQFCSTAGVSQKFTPEDQQTVMKIKKKYNIKINIEKEAPGYWDWTCSQIGYDVPLINAYALLGNLRLLQTCLNNSSN